MEKNIKEEITRLIKSNEIKDPNDERIETCIADLFPNEYCNDQEFVDFQIEIAKLIGV